MNEIQELQNWYLSQCNDDWEHTYGIKIENIDNPGWMIKIDLYGTNLENVPFEGCSYGVGEDAEDSGNNWLFTHKEKGKFVGCGGPCKLQELISIFVAWAKSNA